MFQRLRNFLFGRPVVERRSTEIVARYDNATTTDENQRHWWATDALSAKAANNFAVRRTLRMRSRYEVANNPYLFGVVDSASDDTISTGPTLQCLTKSAEHNRQIEAAWQAWVDEVQLVEKLKTCQISRIVDGEGFLILKSVKELAHPVKLYPVDIEADQVTTVAPKNLAQYWVDGVDLHPVTGQPVRYHVLKNHPGDNYAGTMNPTETETIPAKFVVHSFSRFRAGQVRGIPVFSSSLDLFTELRSFRKSTVGAAQIAADHALVLESQAPADYTSSDSEDDPNAFKRFPMERNGIVQLPWGTTAKTLPSANPSTNYEMFQRACIQEACRPLGYPLISALGSADKFNFSSAKLDIENWREKVEVARKTEIERKDLAKLFEAFVEEGVTIPGLLPRHIQSAADIPHAWHWPGWKPLDPLGDAQADIQRMAAGQDTWQNFWARRGYDWRDVLAAQSEAQKEIERLGLVFGDPVKQTVSEDGGPPDVGEKPRKAKAFRSAFDESKHPSADDGKFGEGHGDGDGKKSGSKTAEKPSHDHDMKGLEDKLPDEAASPGTWKKIKSFVSTASKAIYTGAAALGHKLHDLAPDVLDVAADYAKIFYAGKGSGRGDTPDPFTESVGVGANTIAVVASHLLGRASVWLKNKIGVSFATGENGEPIDVSAIVDILETMFREMHEDLGIEDMDIDREKLAEMIEDRVGADA